MRTKLVQWLCIAALFVALVSWRVAGDYDLAFRVVACAGAAVAAVQAFRAAQHRWTAGAVTIVPLPIFAITDRNPGSESR